MHWLIQVIFLTQTGAFVKTEIPFTKYLRHHRHRTTLCNRGSTSLRATSRDSNEPVKRSVSDYMGGHHAGKFDFDTRISGVTALNYEKSLVFEPDFKPGAILAEIESGVGMPSWATRKVELGSVTGLREDIHIGKEGGIVSIRNQELTWEPFYASIENENGVLQSDISVTPCYGILAPRGGANNACDENRPYSDKWDLKLGLHGSLQGVDLGARGEGFLVVRTECEHYVWRIQL